ncbi:MAG: oligopeptide:H+ symporter, partial [Gammaproteobacteria bacterium]
MTAHATRAGFFGHPRGLSTLFFTEMWERFSFYGMRAILILFMTAPAARGGLGFDVAHAGTVYGLYTALVYLACLPGGWLADRLIGQRRATFAGGVVIMCGHVALAVPTLTSFYLGLALLVVGTGLLKPNISTLVGQLYADDDSRRDAGYSLYYMGINTGAFMAPLVCGWLAQGAGFRRLLDGFGIDPGVSWHFGFGAAAVGMALGLLHYLAGRRHLGDAGAAPSAAGTGPDARRQLARGVLVLAAAAALLAALSAFGVVTPSAAWLGNAFGVVLLVITVAFFGWVFGQAEWTPDERRRLVLVLVLFLGATVFWSLYEQGGS